MKRVHLSGRVLAALVAALALFLAAPLLVNDYLLTILIVILYFAYTGQAWNIMMGFAGQLSLGHALYVGLGAYTTAALYVHFGVAPWLGLPLAIAVSAATGAFIGFLAFRFRVAGVYFAILTIAFAEFARIGFDHFAWVGGSAGFFLPVANYAENDLWNLRGRPIMFYYLMLALTVAALVLCHALLRSRVGYYWLAIREDEPAARALGIDTFRYKMYAVVLSAGMTSIAGVFFAFYYNNLFPEQVFNIARSIELILAPIIGGIGTLIGPIIGAFLLTGLAEAIFELMSAVGFTPPGAKQVFYGLCLLVVIVALPDGVWPPLARALGLGEGTEKTAAEANRFSSLLAFPRGKGRAEKDQDAGSRGEERERASGSRT
jgi:branched-chain amino acid transport system permease protein